MATSLSSALQRASITNDAMPSPGGSKARTVQIFGEVGSGRWKVGGGRWEVGRVGVSRTNEMPTTVAKHAFHISYLPFFRICSFVGRMKREGNRERKIQYSWSHALV